MTTEPRLLSIEDAAECMAVSADSVRNEIEAGRLPCVRIGSRRGGDGVAVERGGPLCRRFARQSHVVCSDPEEAWATRVMLRLWREVCAPLWDSWQVKAAISYSHNTMHRGDIYKFDGWQKLSESCGKSGGGGAWSRKRYAQDVVKGSKTLWIWRYEAAS